MRRLRRAGSPPHVRGKESVLGLFDAHVGIIPARAGKSRRQNWRRQSSGDHPRVCGEKFASQRDRYDIRGSPPRVREKSPLTCPSAQVMGSPPRVRGKVPKLLHRGRWFGITPARAGKSSPPSLRRREARDHPRACGEKDGMHRDVLHAQGSPPRVRGKGYARCRIRDRRGITPARAGKRWCSRLRSG